MSRSLVVIGHGMVAHRFIELFREADPDCGWSLTVVSAERHHAYNRVKLTDLVAGKVRAAELTLERPNAVAGVAVHRGSAATSVDVGARQVTLDSGRVIAYDCLVLATGAQAWVPEIHGLQADNSYVVRDLDDAEAIVAASTRARSAVVLGAGVLGLEMASALAGRGLDVTLVHPFPAVMDRHLGTDASTAAVTTLERAGVRTVTGAGCASVQRSGTEVTAMHLSDGTSLAADMYVLCCGTRARTHLARTAGIECARGIVTDESGRTSAADVFAIGDCTDASPGLVAAGWEQAAAVVRALLPDRTCRSAPDEPGEVVRVKSDVLDLVVMGRPQPMVDDQVVRLSDSTGRFLEVVVAQERVVGATCIGGGQVSVDLVTAFTRGSAVPQDPAHLLLGDLGRPAAAPESPMTMPARTTVCRCNGVTKQDIVACFGSGARTAVEIAAGTRATTGCGGCVPVVEGIVEWLNASDPRQTATLEDSLVSLNAGESHVSRPKHAQALTETSQS